MGPDAHGFLMLCHWFSLSAPSYTCLPKLLKMLGCPAPVVDVVWIAALAGWTFWRVPTLTAVYGVGFDGLRWRGQTPEYVRAKRARRTCEADPERTICRRSGLREGLERGVCGRSGKARGLERGASKANATKECPSAVEVGC
jgi:hypothetical protein